eukprot:3174954-Amphidinium_carterae.1
MDQDDIPLTLLQQPTVDEESTDTARILATLPRREPEPEQVDTSCATASAVAVGKAPPPNVYVPPSYLAAA